MFPIIDLRKMQRPERSGWISVLLCYVLLTGAAEITGNKGKPSLGCLLVPLACWDLPARPPQPRPKEWKVTHITLTDPFAKGKSEKSCSCHFSFLFFGYLQGFLPPDVEPCENPSQNWLLDHQWHSVAEIFSRHSIDLRDSRRRPEGQYCLLYVSSKNDGVCLKTYSDQIRWTCDAPLNGSEGILIDKTGQVH